MALPQTHIELEDRMGQDSAAAGLAYPFIIETFEEQLQALDENERWISKGLPVPTTPLALTVKINDASPDFDARGSRFTFSKVELELHIVAQKDSTDEFRVLRLTYSLLAFRVGVTNASPGRLSLTLSEASDPQITPIGSEPSDDLIETYYGGDRAEYDRAEYAVRWNAATVIPSAIGEFFQFPRLLAALDMVRFEPPYEIAFLTHYLVVGARNVVIKSPHCPVGGVGDGDLELVPFDDEEPEPGTNSLTIIGPESRAPRAGPWRDDSPFLLYLPKAKTYAVTFDILKPALAANDYGSFLCVYWEYFVTLALKEATLTMRVNPPELIVGSHFDLFGAAGAGITIACVRYEVLGAKIGNGVDVSVALRIDFVDRKLTWYTEFEGQPVISLQLYSNDLFPLDVVATEVLSGVAENAVRPLVSRTLNGFRGVLFDLDKIKAPILPDLDALRSISSASALYGVARRGLARKGG